MGKFRILIIEDDISVTGVLEDLFSGEGFEVKTARSGEEGLELLFKEPFDISVIDIRLEGMDGLEVMKQIQSREIKTQVVLITSYASFETVVDALRMGAFDYLIKPFESLDHVLEVIRRTIGKVELEKENTGILDVLKAKNQELEDLNIKIQGFAVRDGLTGLYNYRFFKEALSREYSRSQRHKHKFSVLMMDVDLFKAFNDTYGHLVGDKVLKEISRVLMDRARKSDIICRYGGEEFAAILPETTKSQAAKVAQDIRRRIGKLKFPKEKGVTLGKITISLGVAEYPSDANDALGLVKQADTALYGAKYNGRNQVVLAGKNPGVKQSG